MAVSAPGPTVIVMAARCVCGCSFVFEPVSVTGRGLGLRSIGSLAVRRVAVLLCAGTGSVTHTVQ